MGSAGNLHSLETVTLEMVSLEADFLETGVPADTPAVINKERKIFNKTADNYF